MALFFSPNVFASENGHPDIDTKARDKEVAAVSDGTQITLKVHLNSPAFSTLPVAVVNDDNITLKNLNDALSSSHEVMSDDKKKAAKVDYSEIIKRLVNVKLVIQEARKIGIDELPEIKKRVDGFSKVTLRELLQKDYVKDIKADEKEVDKEYQEMIKEWKIKSVFFKKEDDVKEFDNKVKAGGDFDEMVKNALAEGSAKGGEEGIYIKNKELLPQIAKALTTMKVGSVSPVIKVDAGYTIVRLDDIRFQENPETKEQARQNVLNIQHFKELTNYNKALSKKYVKLNKAVIDSLDYDSKKLDIDRLLKDKRVIADIKGEQPITAGELTKVIVSKFYHGVEKTSKGKSKKINLRKIEVMQELLAKRIFRLEALKKGIQNTEGYKNEIREYEDSLIFDAFIQKVVYPDIKISKEDLKTYYNDHISEYTYPEMVSINSLVFRKSIDAESALDKLIKGSDFNWVKANAGGQVEKDTEGLLPFEGNTFVTNGLPAEFQETLSGVRAEDFRLHKSTDGYFYLLYIKDVIPSKQQPFEEVMAPILDKVFDAAASKLLEEWYSKLRESADIKIYLANDKEKDVRKAN